MSKETYLKIGSVLIYLFIPPFILRLLTSFIEVLFMYQIDSYVLVLISIIISTIICYLGIGFIFISDSYILKQKDK